MCFSASASFTLGSVLLIVGAGTVKKAVTFSQVPFAIIPILFSLQQIIEGFLWLALTNPSWESWQQPSTYLFLAFAQVLWPSWVPFSMFLLEENERRKKGLLALTGFGCVVSLYVMYALVNYPVDAHISRHHVSYDLSFPDYIIELSGVYYFIPTVVPAFVSSIRLMVFLGLALLTSFVVTKLFFGEHVISVWCYFAAAISIIVIIIMMAFHSNSRKSTIAKNVS